MRPVSAFASSGVAITQSPTAAPLTVTSTSASPAAAEVGTATEIEAFLINVICVPDVPHSKPLVDRTGPEKVDLPI
jgi:hypothetical protein